jgi:cytosine/adenosine deaminase-related metal-dependent hydrolase
METTTDSDLPQWWRRLGLPGVVDVHTHYLPERMLRSLLTSLPGNLEALERLREREPRLDDDWLRAVCWFTGQRLIGD